MSPMIKIFTFIVKYVYFYLNVTQTKPYCCYSNQYDYMELQLTKLFIV